MSEHPTGYEKSDVNVGRLAIVTIFFAAVVLGCIVLLNDFFLISTEQTVQEMVLQPQSTQLNELRNQQQQVLTSYGVIDADKGIYRIPVERAMQLLADESFDRSVSQSKGSR